MRFSDVRIEGYGSMKVGDQKGLTESHATVPNTKTVQFPLFIIKEAWDRGCRLSDLVDEDHDGTREGRWWSIENSSTASHAKMLERALNYLFGDEGLCGQAKRRFPSKVRVRRAAPAEAS